MDKALTKLGSSWISKKAKEEISNISVCLCICLCLLNFLSEIFYLSRTTFKSWISDSFWVRLGKLLYRKMVEYKILLPLPTYVVTLCSTNNVHIFWTWIWKPWFTYYDAYVCIHSASNCYIYLIVRYLPLSYALSSWYHSKGDLSLCKLLNIQCSEMLIPCLLFQSLSNSVEVKAKLFINKLKGTCYFHYVLDILNTFSL